MVSALVAQEPPQFSGVQRMTNRELVLQLTAPTALNYRIEVSTNLLHWDPLLTLRSVGPNRHTDSAAPYLISRVYRAFQLNGTNDLTGDHLVTDDGDVTFHPINHATFVMSWNGKMIYNDPVGAATSFQGMPRADLILVSHNHSDHYSNSTLNSVTNANTVILAPQSVYSSMTANLKSLTLVMTNGATKTVLGVGIEAVPAYNLTSANHPKGVGNGYVLTIGGRRVYMSGDSEDIPEMRALQNIDVAFVCMNIPYTMPVAKAVSAIREFRPRVVYPYHFQNQDSSYANLNTLKQQVGTDLGIEVRLRKWY
jgi:L-ascorbate metabolism protein UlaG (beta-lactamase superfamily)